MSETVLEHLDLFLKVLNESTAPNQELERTLSMLREDIHSYFSNSSEAISVLISQFESTQSPHSSICKFLFSQVIESAKLAYVQFDGEYLDWDEGEQRDLGSKTDARQGDFARLSILSDELLSYEAEIFNKIAELNASERLDAKELLDWIYDSFEFRPFHFAFLLNIEKSDSWTQKTFLSTEVTTQQRNNSSDGVVRRWYKARAIQASQRDDSDTHILPGYFECGASPLEYVNGDSIFFTKGRKTFAIIDDDEIELEQIEEYREELLCVDAAKHEELHNITTLHLGNEFDLDDVCVYNVGHGNCIRLVGHNDNGEQRRVLYDIGRGVRLLRNSVPTSVGHGLAQLGFKPQLVILSHWDADHILGHLYCSREIYEVPWIAPTFIPYGNRNIPAGALRLAKFLKLKGSLVFAPYITYPNNVGPYLVHIIPGSNSVIAIFEGSNGSKDSSITKWNRNGLYLMYAGCKNGICRKMLLLGDVPYSCLDIVPAAVLASCDYLIVPHHGRAMNTSMLATSNSSLRRGYAVVSRGQSDMDSNHMRTLMNAGLTVVKTKDAKKSIDIKGVMSGQPPTVN